MLDMLDINRQRHIPLTVQAMFLRGLLLLVLSSGHIISATPFLPAGDHTSNFSGALDVVEPLYPSNASTSPHDTSTQNSLTIHCDGDTYGHNPSIRDCDSISKYLAPDETIWTFAQRHSGLPPDTVPLPFLLMGDQGLCYIQTVLIGDDLTATASKTMLRRAAAALVGQCAAGASQGGIATNIGGDNHLAVILGTYHRQPTCREESASWQSCRNILYTMPADRTIRIFGPEADPTATEILPLRIPSGDGGCTATVCTTGDTDVVSFYDLWVALNAVFSVCSRRNLGGTMRGLGFHGRIYLIMTAEQRLELPSNTSVVVTT